MPIDTFENGETLAQVRAKLNAAIDEVNRAPIAARFAIADNATPTPFASQGAFVKVVGANAAAMADAGLVVSDGRIAYTGPGVRRFVVTVLSTATGAVNNQIAMRIAKNGVTCPLCTIPATMPTSGRPTPLPSQGYFSLEDGDYVEPWIANKSGTASVTITDLSMLAVEIKTPNGV